MKKWWMMKVSAVATFLTVFSNLPVHQVQAASNNMTVNIGYSQGFDLLGIAKAKGWMSQAFGRVGANVNWYEFQNGVPEMQAIAGNHLDLGNLGNTPPITGQAAGVSFKEIGLTSDGLRAGAAILVAKNSSIQTVADLKGKKVAVSIGSQAYDFLYNAIIKNGLKPSDLQIINLQPSDAKAAFNAGKVDAWVVADPNRTIEVVQHAKRVLASQDSLGILSPGFIIARSSFAAAHPDLVIQYLKVVNQTIQWERSHFNQAVQFYAKQQNLPQSLVRVILRNSLPVLHPVSKQVVASQQQQATFLYQIGQIKQQINVSTVVDNSYVTKAIQ